MAFPQGALRVFLGDKRLSIALGMRRMTTIHDLETPAVLIDCACMERNITTMHARCEALGMNCRSHVKTHKSPEIARQQIQAGGSGIACQKVSEAEVFADAGFMDIQITNNIVGAQKTARLAALAGRCQVCVSADDAVVIAGLAEAAAAARTQIGVMVDLATDLQRTGAAPAQVVGLAQQIEAAPYLRFAGLMLYPSRPVNRPVLLDALRQLDQAGIAVDVISGGGTSTVPQAHEIPELTELCVGVYIFHDWVFIENGTVTPDDCALHVLATVISHPVAERVILDCGSKTLAFRDLHGRYGYLPEYPQARIYKLSEEHAYVDVSACGVRPQIGERVHVLPVQTGLVANLTDQMYGMRGDQVEVVWDVAARGRVW